MLVRTGLRRVGRGLSPLAVPGLSGWWKQGDWTAASERISQWNDSSGNARHLLQAAGVSQPIELPWSGENYYYVQSGTTGNRVTTPDNVAYDLTQFSAVFRLAFDNAASGATTRIGGGQMTSASADLSWLFALSSTGFPQLSKTIDGTTAVTRVSSAAATTVAANYAFCWWMVTFDSTTGQPMFYYNITDSNTIPTSWTQFGTVPATIATGIWTSGSAICLGAAGTSGNTGTAYKIKRYALYSGLIQTDGTGGTLVLDCDMTAQSENATSWVASTGQTWTAIGSGAKPSQIVGSKQILGDDAASFMRATYTQAQPVTRFVLYRRNINSATDTIIDGANGTAGCGRLIGTSAALTTEISAGSTVGALATPALNNYMIQAAVFNGASSANYLNALSSGTVNAGTQNPDGLTLFGNAIATPTTLWPGQVKEIIEYSRALSSSEISQVLRYLNRISNLGLAL